MPAINREVEAALPTERRHEVFDYDPESGWLIWRRRESEEPIPLSLPRSYTANCEARLT
jgi:hypothetical protein